MRTTTFANIGTDVTGANNVQEVLQKAGLDYNVVTTPIYTQFNGQLVPYAGKVATVREDTGEQLGVVSSSYKICQNVDAFDFVNYISENVDFVKAGQTAAGLIYMIGALDPIQILDEDVTPYVIFQNSHDGLSSVKATISPLRIVCQNQFNIAFKESTNNVSIRHSGEIGLRMIEGQHLLSDVASYMQVFDKNAAKLVAKKMQKRDIIKVFNKLFAYDESKMTPRQIINFEEKREQFMACVDAEDNQNYHRTAWGVINGFADFATHKPLSNRANAADSAFVNTSLLSTEMTRLFNMLAA